MKNLYGAVLLFATLVAAMVLAVCEPCFAAGPPGSVPWLSLAGSSDSDPAVGTLHPAWSVGGPPATCWSSLEVPNPALAGRDAAALFPQQFSTIFDFTGLDAWLASSGGRQVILKIMFPPPDVTASNYVDRLGRLFEHLCIRYTTARNNLWIAPENEPSYTPEGFDRHAAILQRCHALSRGRIKIVGFMLQGGGPEAFKGLVDRGCATNCDAVSFHQYGSWYTAPDVPYNPANHPAVQAQAPSAPLYDGLMADKAMLPPGMPMFCDEVGFVRSNADRNAKTILIMLAAGVQLIQVHVYQLDWTFAGDDASRFKGDDTHSFYGCWNNAANRAAPWGQCLVDIAKNTSGKPTLTRFPNGRHVVTFPNGVSYAWNTNNLAPIERTGP